jgi:hypothetical protein
MCGSGGSTHSRTFTRSTCRGLLPRPLACGLIAPGFVRIDRTILSAVVPLFPRKHIFLIILGNRRQEVPPTGDKTNRRLPQAACSRAGRGAKFRRSLLALSATPFIVLLQG